jgi:hypothetical protein
MGQHRTFASSCESSVCISALADPRVVDLALERIPAASNDGKYNLILVIKGAFDRLPPVDQERVARDLRALDVGESTRELIDSSFGDGGS